MIRNIIINTVILLVSVLLALVLGELLIRVVAPQKLYRFPQFMFVNHESADYKLAPNFDGVSETSEYETTVLTNSIGIRDEREFTERAVESHRVVAIGDSFTMGVGVDSEQTFLATAENLLSSRDSESKYEIINLGVPGYRTSQEIALLQDIGMPLKPDTILLSFYLGNDIAQNAAPNKAHVSNGYIRAAQQADGLLPTRMRDYLQINSHLYQLLWPVQRRLLDNTYAEKQLAAQRKRFAIYDANRSDDAALWKPTYDLIKSLHDLAYENDTKLVVVIIPEVLQMNEQLWQETANFLSTSETRFVRAHPASKVASYCDQLSIPYESLLGPLSAAPNGEHFYFAVDGHWNIDGNRKAGEILADFLVRQITSNSDDAARAESTADNKK